MPAMQISGKIVTVEVLAEERHESRKCPATAGTS
jgi:hypothetical protein